MGTSVLTNLQLTPEALMDTLADTDKAENLLMWALKSLRDSKPAIREALGRLEGTDERKAA